MQRVRCCAIFLLVLPAMGFAGQQKPTAAPGETPAQVNTSTYLLSPGDVVELKFSYNPELNETVTIRPDGVVSLVMIGEVPAQGVAPADFGDLVADKYGEFLRHPEVTAIVREFSGQRVYVGGEVNSPGVVALRGTLTCLRAILNSGGPKPSAKMNTVILIRYRGKDGAEVQKMDLTRVMEGKAPDVELKPYDVVFVPKTRIARVGLFMEHYVNSLIPRSIMFPYNLNNIVTVQD